MSTFTCVTVSFTISRSLDETVLLLTRPGLLIEAGDDGLEQQTPSDPRQKTTKEKSGQSEDDALITHGKRKPSLPLTIDKQDRTAIGKKLMQKSRRRQAIEQDLPDFPTFPDVFISEEKLEQRRVRFRRPL